MDHRVEDVDAALAAQARRQARSIQVRSVLLTLGATIVALAFP